MILSSAWVVLDVHLAILSEMLVSLQECQRVSPEGHICLFASWLVVWINVSVCVELVYCLKIVTGQFWFTRQLPRLCAGNAIPVTGLSKVLPKLAQVGSKHSQVLIKQNDMRTEKSDQRWPVPKPSAAREAAIEHRILPLIVRLIHSVWMSHSSRYHFFGFFCLKANALQVVSRKLLFFIIIVYSNWPSLCNIITIINANICGFKNSNIFLFKTKQSLLVKLNSAQCTKVETNKQDDQRQIGRFESGKWYFVKLIISSHDNPILHRPKSTTTMSPSAWKKKVATWRNFSKRWGIT